MKFMYSLQIINFKIKYGIHLRYNVAYSTLGRGFPEYCPKRPYLEKIKNKKKHILKKKHKAWNFKNLIRKKRDGFGELNHTIIF